MSRHLESAFMENQLPGARWRLTVSIRILSLHIQESRSLRETKWMWVSGLPGECVHFCHRTPSALWRLHKGAVNINITISGFAIWPTCSDSHLCALSGLEILVGLQPWKQSVQSTSSPATAALDPRQQSLGYGWRCTRLLLPQHCRCSGRQRQEWASPLQILALSLSRCIAIGYVLIPCCEAASVSGALCEDGGQSLTTKEVQQTSVVCLP